MGIRRSAAVVAAAILLTASACSEADEPSPASPPEAESTADPAPEPVPDPEPADEEPEWILEEPAPALPESFGSWNLENINDYRHEDEGIRVAALHWVYTTEEAAQQDIDSEWFDDWLCGLDAGEIDLLTCSARAWDGSIQLVSSDLDVAELIAFGDELLANWG